MQRAKSLYVHIPYCRTICPYCDFCKVMLSTGKSELYVGALLNEDRLRYSGYEFETIYIGGGTPSCLDKNLMSTLLSSLIGSHGVPKELTVECNPEDVDREYAEFLKSNGVNRVSLGVQSSNDRTLRKLGRRHFIKGAENAVKVLRDAGIDNVSADFIYGLPYDNIQNIRDDIDWVLKMQLPHCSFYSCQIEPHTIFGNKKLPEPDQDWLDDAYNIICKGLESGGLKRYEISNFANPGYESRHNLCYWHSNPYGAIGLGATSFENGIREVRIKSMKEYLYGNYTLKTESESIQEQEFDYLMLNLRLTQGFSLAEFKERFGHDFLSDYHDKIQALASVLSIENGWVKVIPDKLYVLDSILVDLLKFKD